MCAFKSNSNVRFEIKIKKKRRVRVRMYNNQHRNFVYIEMFSNSIMHPVWGHFLNFCYTYVSFY